MKPVYQSRTDEPAQHGDCFAACVASMLELPLCDVPHFYADSDRTDRPLLPRELAFQQQWFASQGITYVEFGFVCALSLIFKNMAERNGTLHYLLTGNNLRRRAHSVIARGDRIVHDPAVLPAEATAGLTTIVGPCNDGAYRVGFMVRNL